MKNLITKIPMMCLFVAVSIATQFIPFDSLAKKVLNDPYLTKSFNLSSGELFVSTSGGSIRVKGSNSNKVVVEMYVKSSKHSDSKIKEILEEDYEIRIEKVGSKIEVVAKRTGRSWSSNGISISFVVYTPGKFACDLNTSGGSLKISGLQGRSHELKTSGGSITAEDMNGGFSFRSQMVFNYSKRGN